MKKIIIIVFPIIILLIPKTNINTYINQDNIIATLTIPNIIYNEPITQYKDNEYYLSHDIDNNENIIAITFLDYRNKINDKIKIIYSHNSRTYITPFKNLEKYYNEDFFMKNKTIMLSTKNKTYNYEIFAILLITNDYFYTNLNPLNIDKYIKKIKTHSLYYNDIDLTKEDNILILQTCSYKKNYKYLLIVAKETT